MYSRVFPELHAAIAYEDIFDTNCAMMRMIFRIYRRGRRTHVDEQGENKLRSFQLWWDYRMGLLQRRVGYDVGSEPSQAMLTYMNNVRGIFTFPEPSVLSLKTVSFWMFNDEFHCEESTEIGQWIGKSLCRSAEVTREVLKEIFRAILEISTQESTTLDESVWMEEAKLWFEANPFVLQLQNEMVNEEGDPTDQVEALSRRLLEHIVGPIPAPAA